MKQRIDVFIRNDQYDFLKQEAKRLKISIEESLLVFLLDGRLTPSKRGTKTSKKRILRNAIR